MMPPLLAGPETLEFVSHLSIAVIATALAALSGLAWRRERDRRMLVVTAAYGLIVLSGLAVVLEDVLARSFSPLTVEQVEHGAPFLIAVALLLFFVALTRR